MTPSKREAYIKYCTQQMIESLNAGNHLTAQGWRKRAEKSLAQLDEVQARKLRQTDIKNGRHVHRVMARTA